MFVPQYFVQQSTPNRPVQNIAPAQTPIASHSLNLPHGVSSSGHHPVASSSHHHHATPVVPAAHSVPLQKRQPRFVDNSPIVPKKKARTTDRDLPSHLDTVVPESRLYTELQTFEKRLDAIMLRKRLDIQEALAKPSKHTTTTRTLRIFVSNTSTNQSMDDSAENLDNEASVPSWTLRIEGRLLEPANAAGKSKQPGRKFSSFIKSLVVEIGQDNTMYHEGNLVEWNKLPAAREFDGFEIKRQSDRNTKVKIIITVDYQPERFRLSPPLASLLDIMEETRAGVISAMYHYIRHRKLSVPEDRRIINCDAQLRGIFGKDRIAFFQIPELIMPHMLPIEPIIIPYTVRTDKEFHQSRFAYDVEVELDDVLRARMHSVLANTVSQKEVQVIDEKITACVQSINNSKIKRDFLLEFSQSPVNFINNWVASQSADLEMVLNESRVNLEEQRTADFYKQGWVKEAIFHYMSAKTQRRMHELMGVGQIPGMGPRRH